MNKSAGGDRTADPWRTVCPNGHAAFETVSDDRIWCRSCAADSEISTATHHTVRDKKHDEMVQWSAIS